MGDRPGLVVFGAGRMGRLVHDIADEAGFRLAGVVSRTQPGWETIAPFAQSLDGLDESVSLVIDFSLPQGTLTAASWCADNGVALLSGTTGLDEEQGAALEEAAERVPVLWAANFSPGINLCLELAAIAASRLQGVEGVQVTDVHHVHKKDAPSGTALALGAAAAPYTAVYDSIREGEAVGIHELRFKLAGEEVGIIHNAVDRGIYARGALRAGHWLLNREAGKYDAGDAFS